MLILVLRETVLWPLLDWSGALFDAATLVFRTTEQAPVRRETRVSPTDTGTASGGF